MGQPILTAVEGEKTGKTVTTLYGLMHEDALDGPVYSVEECDEWRADATEYRLKGELVHRAVHVTIKQGLGIEGVLGALGDAEQPQLSIDGNTGEHG